jgi:hypothetical protein
MPAPRPKPVRRREEGPAELPRLDRLPDPIADMRERLDAEDRAARGEPAVEIRPGLRVRRRAP